MNERLAATVHGRVQGVGFRYFVQTEARRLRLSGYVRNCPNGRRVEVVAEGDRPSLERLVGAVRQGPPGAYVERVDVSREPASGEFSGFSVRH
ncbi:MAG: acylphosphatase [Chloroflexi bacterium]|nr:acylphosphatase [Chloroflexota bacterium]